MLMRVVTVMLLLSAGIAAEAVSYSFVSKASGRLGGPIRFEFYRDSTTRPKTDIESFTVSMRTADDRWKAMWSILSGRGLTQPIEYGVTPPGFTTMIHVTSLVATLLFLRVWPPKRIGRFADDPAVDAFSARSSIKHYSGRQIARAWMPFAILSIFVLCWGLPSIKTALNQATTPSFKVVMADGKPRPGPPGWDWPYLHGKVSRTAPVVA